MTPITAADAQALLDNATPGPWTRPSATSNWFTVPQPIQIDEADWGQEVQDRHGAIRGYRIATLADDRAWRYADVDLIAAAPDLAATVVHLTAEIERLRAELDRRTNPDLAVMLRRAAREMRDNDAAGWAAAIFACDAAARLIDGEGPT